jgi:hypothetical protein
VFAALVEIIPLAIVAAVNPIGAITSIALQRSRRPVANTVAYVAGGATMYVVVAILGLLVLGAIQVFGQQGSASTGNHWLDVGLGIALTAAGLVLIVKHKPRHLPSRVERVLSSLGPVKAFGLGVVILSPGARSMAMLFVALGTLAGRNLGAVKNTIALAVFVLIAIGPAMAPVVVALTKPPEAARVTIGTWTAWLERNGQLLLGAALLCIGVKLLIEGAVSLAS